MNRWNRLKKLLDPFEHRLRPLRRCPVRQLRDDDEITLIFLRQKTLRQLLIESDAHDDEQRKDRHDTDRPGHERGCRVGIAPLRPAEYSIKEVPKPAPSPMPGREDDPAERG